MTISLVLQAGVRLDAHLALDEFQLFLELFFSGFGSPKFLFNFVFVFICALLGLETSVQLDYQASRLRGKVERKT